MAPSFLSKTKWQNIPFCTTKVQLILVRYNEITTVMHANANHKIYNSISIQINRLQTASSSFPSTHIEGKSVIADCE